MNPPTPQQVDAAVRAILADWGRAHRGEPPNVAVFADRLFSLRHAEALAGGTREVRLAPGTVVTPLAHDHLKRLGIALRFVSAGESVRARPEGEWGFAVDVDSGIITALRRLLLDGGDTWSEIGSDANEAARWVVESVNRGAVVLTSEASVATWRACQVAGVRAATVVDAEAVARAVRHLGANLLVVEPAGKSIHSLKQLFTTFRRAGGPTSPAWMGDDHANRRGDRPSHARPGAPELAERPLPHRLADAARGPDRRLARSW